MIGLILFDKKYQKIIAAILLIAILITTMKFGILKSNKGIYYYQNFISYVMGQKTMISYQAFFDKNTVLRKKYQYNQYFALHTAFYNIWLTLKIFMEKIHQKC